MYEMKKLSWLTLTFNLVLLVLFVSTASADLVIDQSYQLISKKRVGRTAYEYTYQVNISNNGSAVQNVTASVTSSSPHTTIVDGDINFGDVVGGSTVTGADTFSFRQNRRYPFDPSALSWDVQFTEPLNDPNPGIPEFMEGAVFPPDEPVETTIITYVTDEGNIVDSEAASGRVLVLFDSDVTEDIAESLIVANSGNIIGKVPSIGYYYVEVTSGNEVNFITLMRQKSEVVFAELDNTVSGDSVYIENPIEINTNPRNYLDIIHAPEAWEWLSDKIPSQSIEICIIDSGFL